MLTFSMSEVRNAAADVLAKCLSRNDLKQKLTLCRIVQQVEFVWECEISLKP